MQSSPEHYDALLADIYTWMVGGPQAASAASQTLFEHCGVAGHPHGVAIDLGCGPGFQSLALAKLGYKVLAVDNCAAFLKPLEAMASHLQITPIQDDLLNFERHIQSPVQLVACLGDTLTHLSSLDEVARLLSSIQTVLDDSGTVVLTLRDYTNEPPATQRFIPVRSDDTRILTCHLQFFDSDIEVTDLLYTREPSGWTMSTSSYRKIRVPISWLVNELESRGFQIRRETLASGMICIVGSKAA